MAWNGHNRAFAIQMSPYAVTFLCQLNHLTYPLVTTTSEVTR